MNETPRLLLVVPEEVLRDITAFRLELLGYAVECAGNGSEVLAKIEQHRPDLVILDTVLPDVDGVDVVYRMGNDARYSEIPVLVFSIDSDLEAVRRAYAAGASDYLLTPYDPAVLEHKIEKLLSARQGSKKHKARG